MHFRLCVVLCCFLVPCIPCPALGGKQAAAAELKWARGIADDFWEAALNEDEETAAGLLSTELARSVSAAYPQGAAVYLHQQIGSQVGYYRPAPVASVSVVSETLAPDRSEAVFTGVLTTKDKKKADFTLRIAREGSGGRWSIRFIRVREQQAKKE